MKLIVFGATGSLGRHITQQALEAGHQVTAVSRRGVWEGAHPDNLHLCAADVLDARAVAAALPGHDAVICALGAGRDGGLRAPGTANIVAGMQAHGLRRIVCLSTLGAGDSWSNLTWFWKYPMFSLLLRPAFRDHLEQEAILRRSDLDWTIVRPAGFTDGPATGRFRHGFAPGSPRGLQLRISRADVAGFMLGQLGASTYLRQAPGLSY